MTIKTLLQETHDEAAEVLHNARAAQLDGKMTYAEYCEIRQSVFDACAASVDAALLFGEDVSVL